MTQDVKGVKRLLQMAALSASVKAAIQSPQAGTFIFSADEVIKLAEDVKTDVEAAFKAGWEMSETTGAEDKWEDAFAFYNSDVEHGDAPGN